MVPWLRDFLELANSAGGMAGLAALIGSLATLRRRDDHDAGIKEDVADVRRDIATLQAGLKSVQAQVEHNHGSSMKDQVTRIESTQAVMHRDISDMRRDLSDARHDHDERLHSHDERLHGHDERIRTIEARP